MTVRLVVSLPKISHIHRIYMVLANPSYVALLLPFSVLEMHKMQKSKRCVWCVMCV